MSYQDEIREEIELLERSIASAKELNAHPGILLIPEELSVEVVDIDTSEDAKKTFEAELMEAMARPVPEGEGIDGSFMPFIIRGPKEFFDDVNLQKFRRDGVEQMGSRLVELRAKLEE